MKIVFLTVHDATSSRKVDFHFWADVFTSRSIFVDFVTVGFSPITQYKKGGRKYKPPFNSWIPTRPFERKFLWCPLFHPFGMGHKILDKISWHLFKIYPKLMPKSLLMGISDADIFIVENGAGLLVIPALAKKFPNAKFIYNVCDRIDTLGYHPIILDSEKKALKDIDLIRVPAEVMKADYGNACNIEHIPHGLQKSIFDSETQTPYDTDVNAVCVGDMLFDRSAVSTLAKNNPNIMFHLFGKNAVLENNFPNVISHGEKPFDEIVPYIKHATVGLAPYRPAISADYLSQSSMKMIQYTYCRLPIIAPGFAASGRPHVIGYDPDDETTIVNAMNIATGYSRNMIDSSKVMNWEQTVDQLLLSLNRPSA